MAFALTNKAFSSPPIACTYIGELADQAAAGTLTDTGVTGLKHMRGRIYVKSGMANTETFAFYVRVDDTAALASPQLIYQSPTYTTITADTESMFDFECSSHTGFRYFQIVAAESGTTAMAYDALIQCW